MSQEISVTRALTKIKTLESQINQAINDLDVVTVTTGEKPPIGFQSVPLFDTHVRDKYQSLTDMMSHRKKLRSAITVSNAKTTVEIAGSKMTVAEAINYKTEIEFKKRLLAHLRQELFSAKRTFENIERDVSSRLDDLIEVTYGKRDKVSPNDYDALAKPFLEREGAKLRDPMEISKKIESLNNEITSFETEVDIILSESNAKTMIKID